MVLYLPNRASFPHCGMNSFLSREAPGRPFLIKYLQLQEGDELSWRKGSFPLLWGRDSTNMGAGIGSPAVLGITSMTFFFIGWEEHLNYTELSRWRWSHSGCSGSSLSNWTSLYRVLQCRAVVSLREVISKKSILWFLVGEKQQVDLVSTASAALVRNTQKWSSGGKWGFSSWVAGTGVQGEGTGRTASEWPVNPIQIHFSQVAIQSGPCPKIRGRAGLLLLDRTRTLTDMEWPWAQSQPMEPGSKMEEWSSHEVWWPDWYMELPVLIS